MKRIRIAAAALAFVFGAGIAGAVGQDISGKYERFLNGKPDANSASITLQENGSGKVHVSGNAVWVGDAATGNVNSGEVAGDFPVVNHRILYRDKTGCRMTIAVVQEGLRVSKSTSACGGLNVTFDGTYRKTVP